MSEADLRGAWSRPVSRDAHGLSQDSEVVLKRVESLRLRQGFKFFERAELRLADALRRHPEDRPDFLVRAVMDEEKFEEEALFRLQLGKEIEDRAGFRGRRGPPRRRGDRRFLPKELPARASRDDREPGAEIVGRTERAEHRAVALDELAEDLGPGV